MGVKFFFSWMKKNYGNCIEDVYVKSSKQIEQKMSLDNLAIDMNGVIHYCAQKIYGYGKFQNSKSNYFLDKDQMERRIFKSICERIVFLLDLTAPKKRVLLCIDGVAGLSKCIQQRSRRFRSAVDRENNNMLFDSCSITPGTEFMNKLSKYIDVFLKKFLSEQVRWRHLQIIFSNEKVPGEGEHSILQYIRKYAIRSESYCIAGMDADLVMLALGTSIEQIYIFREDHFRDDKYYIIDISLLKRQLHRDLIWTSNIEHFSKEQCIYDFILICFLLGNDFLPNIPTLEILEGGIQVMIDVYKTICEHFVDKQFHLLTVPFSKFLNLLSQLEPMILERKINKKNSKCYPDKLLDKHCIDAPDKVILDFESYRNEYYLKKFDEKNIKKICSEYIRGLQWIIFYYLKGIPDWSWYYPYLYAPFLVEFASHSFSYTYTPFTQNYPLKPFQQLLAVLPPQSSQLLPSPLSSLMTDDNSPLKKYYPTEFTVDYSGKRNDWEGIIKLPPIDFSFLNKIYQMYLPKVSTNSLNLNYRGKIFSYTYYDGTIEVDTINF